MALTGNQGKSGGGLRVASWWPVEGFDKLNSRARMTHASRWASTQAEAAIWRSASAGSAGASSRTLMQEIVPRAATRPLMPFLYVHAGYSEIWDKRSEYQDPRRSAKTSEYMKEAIEKGWIPIRPRPGDGPEGLRLHGTESRCAAGPRPRSREKHLWPKLDMIVDVNFKVSTSGMNADLILPTAGYYERDSLKYSQAYLPYLVCARRRSSRWASPSPSGRSSAAGAQDPGAGPRARRLGGARLGGARPTLSTIYDALEPRTASSTRAIRRPRSTEILLRRPRSHRGQGFARHRRRGCCPSSRSRAAHSLYAVGATTAGAAPSTPTRASSSRRRSGRPSAGASSS